MANFAVSILYKAVDGLSESFNKWSEAGEKFEKQQKHHFKEASESAKGFKEVFEGTLAAKGVEWGIDKLKELPEIMTQFAEKGAEIGKTSEKLGLTSDQFQRLSYAANIGEVSAERLQISFSKMNLGLGQLSKNQGAFVTGLRRIDPQLVTTLRHTKDSHEAFLALADAVAKTEDPHKRAAMAVAAFGRGGQDLIPFLLKGKEGIAALEAQTQDYVTLIGDDGVQASKKFVEEQKHLKMMTDGVGVSIMQSLLPAINPLLDKVNAWVGANKEIIASNITKFVETLGSGLQAVGGFLSVIGPWLPEIVGGFIAWQGAALFMGVLPGMIKAVAGGLEILTMVTKGAATVQEAFNLVMMANPVGIVVAAVALLVAGIILLAQNWDMLTGKLHAGDKGYVNPEQADKNRQESRRSQGRNTFGSGGTFNAGRHVPNSAGLRAAHPTGRGGGVRVNVNNTSTGPISTTVQTAPDFSRHPADALGQN